MFVCGLRTFHYIGKKVNNQALERRRTEGKVARNGGLGYPQREILVLGSRNTARTRYQSDVAPRLMYIHARLLYLYGKLYFYSRCAGRGQSPADDVITTSLSIHTYTGARARTRSRMNDVDPGGVPRGSPRITPDLS